MPELSRRALLIATATLVTVPASRAGATTSARRADGVGSRAPSALGFPGRVSGQLGPLVVSADIGAGLDAVGLRITITNTGAVAETVTVSFTDLRTGRKSRTRTVKMPAGKTRSRTMFGHLNHQFMIDFCLVGSTCVSLGPIGPQPGTPVRSRRTQGLSVPPAIPEPSVPH